MHQDQRDRERREARAAAAARGETQPLTPEPEALPREMPGSGHLLVAPESNAMIDSHGISVSTGDDENQ